MRTRLRQQDAIAIAPAIHSAVCICPTLPLANSWLATPDSTTTTAAPSDWPRVRAVASTPEAAARARHVAEHLLVVGRLEKAEAQSAQAQAPQDVGDVVRVVHGRDQEQPQREDADADGGQQGRVDLVGQPSDSGAATVTTTGHGVNSRADWMALYP